MSKRTCKHVARQITVYGMEKDKLSYHPAILTGTVPRIFIQHKIDRSKIDGSYFRRNRLQLVPLQVNMRTDER